ncbi:MAG: recombinase family protein [Bdellovibrionales bacterium]|nr:recombinase family protein [Bdellovibrionales bacterium]
MKDYFAYTRVSTPRQGQVGVSLAEQRAAISAFAEARGLHVTQWFEERESAARTGRPIFRQMLARLIRGDAAGLIIHKIDRGARNLRDWADIGDLIDQGIDVHFAHDDLQLGSRGGRLAADIQAVIAADYIRNLREEIRKGILGRLRQGLYPLPAPLGYRNRGTTHAKTQDPRVAPLIKEAFHLYATGTYSLRALAELLAARGLLGRRGQPFTRNTLDRVLRNPFYVGSLCIRTTPQCFPGIHEPLVSRALFDHVQWLLKRRRPWKRSRHVFAYTQFIRCVCGRSLIGERHKGRYIYYRCHCCPNSSIREERFEEQIRTLVPAVGSWDNTETPFAIRLRAHFQNGVQFEHGTVSLGAKSSMLHTG